MMRVMEPPHASANLRHALAPALAPVLWGSTYLLAGEVLASTSPLGLATVRTLPAGLLILAAIRFRRPAMPWHRLLVLSALNITGFQFLLFFSAQRLPGGIAALLGALQPLLLILLAWVLDRQRPTASGLVAALIGIAGVRMVLSVDAGSYDAGGIIAGSSAALCMALGTHLSARWRGADAPLPLIGWQLLSGGMLLLGPALIAGRIPEYGSPREWVGLAYLVIPGTAAAYALWFRGLTVLSPLAVSGLGLLSPLTALFLGWAFLGESLQAVQLSGVVLAMSSLVVLQLPPGLLRRPHHSSRGGTPVTGGSALNRSNRKQQANHNNDETDQASKVPPHGHRLGDPVPAIPAGEPRS